MYKRMEIYRRDGVEYNRLDGMGYYSIVEYIIVYYSIL